MTEMRATREALLDYELNPTLPTCSFCGIFHPNHDDECPITPQVWAEVEAMEALEAAARVFLAHDPEHHHSCPVARLHLTEPGNCTCGLSRLKASVGGFDA